jgi:hypothetical protein
VFELTRTGIEVKNLKMRVESLASRVEFSERRARALESVVAYKAPGDDRDEPPSPQPAPRPGPSPRSSGAVSPPSAATPPPRPIPPPPGQGAIPAGISGPPADAASASSVPAAVSPETDGAQDSPGQRSRRRRRRRGRRSGPPAAALMGASTDPGQESDETPDQTDDADASEPARPDDLPRTESAAQGPRGESRSAAPDQPRRSEPSPEPEHFATSEPERGAAPPAGASASDHGSEPDQQ